MCSLLSCLDNRNIYAIDTVEQNTIYAVGDTGPSAPYAVIEKSTDGGEKWSRVYTYPGPSHFFGIHVPKPCQIWAAGCEEGDSNGYVVRSNDGGCSWSANVFPSNTLSLDFRVYCLYTVHAFDEQVIWVTGRVELGATNAFAVWRSLDGGNTWTKQTATIPTTTPIVLLNSIYIPQGTCGRTVWVAGLGTDGTQLIPLLYRTRDALSVNPTWENITAATEFPNGTWSQVTGLSYPLGCADTGNCVWVTGNMASGGVSKPYIRYSMDDGETWTTVGISNSLDVMCSNNALASSLVVLGCSKCPELWVTLSNIETGTGTPIYNVLLRSCNGGQSWDLLDTRSYTADFGDVGFLSVTPTLIVQTNICAGASHETRQVWKLVNRSSLSNLQHRSALDLLKWRL